MTADEKTTPESAFDSGGNASSAVDAAGPPPSAHAAGSRVSDEEAVPTSPATPGSNDAASPAPAASHPGAEGEQREPAASAEDELAAKAAKADEYLGLAQRTKADFENYRRRAAREAAAAQTRGALRLAQELLPAIDNLERALAHADAEAAEDEDEHSFVAGIRHVHSDVIAALGRAGIERYSPEGERFDPQYHEAVAQQPVDGAEPGTVVEVFQRGYRMGESVVRPARVVVAG